MSCIYDEVVREAAFRGHRNRMLLRRYHEQLPGLGHQQSVEAVAREFGLSTRTVLRVIVRYKEEER